MRILIRLGIGVAAGALSMGVVLGTLESEVNPRRMLFIGALIGLSTTGVLEALQVWRRQQRQMTPLTPVEALSLQLSRLDLPPSDAVAIAEHLATLKAAEEGEWAGASRTSHHAPRS